MYKRIRLTILLILWAGTDAETFAHNAERFLAQLALRKGERMEDETCIIAPFETNRIEPRYISGLNIEFDGQSCCALVLTLADPGRVYDENGKDVEVLIQGEPLQADPNFGIKVIPYESIEEELFKLRFTTKLSGPFGAYYKNLLDAMPDLDEYTFNKIISKYGLVDSPSYKKLSDPKTGGTILRRKSFIRFLPGITKTPDGKAVHINRIESNTEAKGSIIDLEDNLIPHLLITWNGSETGLLTDPNALLICVTVEDMRDFIENPPQEIRFRMSDR